MKEIHLLFGKQSIDITLNGSGGGTVSTTFGEDGETEYNAAIDGIESLLLALAIAGVDIETAQFREAIETAIEACANNI